MPKAGNLSEKKPPTIDSKTNSIFSTTTMLLFSAGVASVVLAYLSFGPVIPAAGQDASPEMDSRGCPIYTEYSTVPHGDKSSGPLGLPFMRPEERCRTFNSSAVEVSPPIPLFSWSLAINVLTRQKVIQDMKDRLKDPDLARLFENTFPSTLDTTVSYFNSEENVAFIITGVSSSCFPTAIC